jgi:hypothetical protein
MHDINLLKPLKALLEIAEKGGDNAFRDGYILALNHAIELAELQQRLIDQDLAVQFGQEVA